ncbi:hypothetical protein AB0K18_16180 [Nonomuraea sp. NPDC049421]|uniref:hypothetical protein n=1 Tax=Nonomuraea sp. NPDC049421 TaxID=3155275 RepID=UPI003415273E
MIHGERPSYDEMVSMLGVPFAVEDARARWGRLVEEAKGGRTIMITRERWEWAALVPLFRVGGVLTGLPLVPLSTARSKLGDLVRQVADPYGEPVLLGRHRKPVAGLVGAHVLLGKDAQQDRTATADALLVGGHTITLAHNPAEGLVLAVARDREGKEVSAGAGRNAREALHALTTPPPWPQT